LEILARVVFLNEPLGKPLPSPNAAARPKLPDGFGVVGMLNENFLVGIDSPRRPNRNNSRVLSLTSAQ
jgi:hypothetical protein